MALSDAFLMWPLVWPRELSCLASGLIRVRIRSALREQPCESHCNYDVLSALQPKQRNLMLLERLGSTSYTGPYKYSYESEFTASSTPAQVEEMAELVANCPRCGSRRITFDVTAAKVIRVEYGWQNFYESFSICRNCERTTVFLVKESVNGDYNYVHKVGLLKVEGSLNKYVEVEGHISLKDTASAQSPEFLPKEIESAFREGAVCLAVGCYNAAGTMFRLCVDLATKSLLPKEDPPGLNGKIRRDLGLRLPWLFQNGLLPEAVKELSTCVKEDGNDGAHAGTLLEADAADLLDFSCALLERIYTEPERLRQAKFRRDARRKPST